MKKQKLLFVKLLGFLFLLPFLYILFALVFTSVSVNAKQDDTSAEAIVYLHTNGVHLDIIIEKSLVDSSLLNGLVMNEKDKFYSFGWGDENFYINTPRWSDLTFENAFRALFLKSTSLMHLTRYKKINPNWLPIKLNASQLARLNQFIEAAFKTNLKAEKQLLKGKGYGLNDDFYYANGSYSCVYTCNSWVNNAFKTSGLKACWWTPFDFGLINKYK